MIFFHWLLIKYTIHWQLMAIHELWNSITFLNFKMPLVIAPRPVSVTMTHCMRKSICGSPLRPSENEIFVLLLWNKFSQLHNWNIFIRLPQYCVLKNIFSLASVHQWIFIPLYMIAQKEVVLCKLLISHSKF